MALVGSGRMGAFHAETLARRLPGARLVAVADPAPRAAERVAGPLGARACTDVAELWHDPQVDAVVIATPTRTHVDLVAAAADAGKASSARNRWRSPCPTPIARSTPPGGPAWCCRWVSTGAGDVAVAEDPEAAGEQTLSLAVACGVLRA
jgi:hypothetical protein